LMCHWALYKGSLTAIGSTVPVQPASLFVPATGGVGGGPDDPPPPPPLLWHAAMAPNRASASAHGSALVRIRTGTSEAEIMSQSKLAEWIENMLTLTPIMANRGWASQHNYHHEINSQRRTSRMIADGAHRS